MVRLLGRDDSADSSRLIRALLSAHSGIESGRERCRQFAPSVVDAFTEATRELEAIHTDLRAVASESL